MVSLIWHRSFHKETVDGEYDQRAETSSVDNGSASLHLSAQPRYGKATKLLLDGGALLYVVNNFGRMARNVVGEKGSTRGRFSMADVRLGDFVESCHLEWMQISH